MRVSIPIVIWKNCVLRIWSGTCLKVLPLVVGILGEIKEKKTAHREYREAISKGHGAYLMDEEEPVSVNSKSHGS